MIELLNVTYSILLNEVEFALAYFQNLNGKTVCEITFILHADGTTSYYHRYEMEPPINDDDLQYIKFINDVIPGFFNNVKYDFDAKLKRKTWKLNIEHGLQGIIISKDKTNFGNGSFVYLPHLKAPLKYDLNASLDFIVSDITNNHQGE